MYYIVVINITWQIGVFSRRSDNSRCLFW